MAYTIYLYYVPVTTNPTPLPRHLQRTSCAHPARPDVTCSKMADMATTSSSLQSPATIITCSSVDIDIIYVFLIVTFNSFILQTVCPFQITCQNKIYEQEPCLTILKFSTLTWLTGRSVGSLR